MIRFYDVIHSAIDSLSANRLRTFLTVSAIAVGITSIVGIETSLEILSGELDSSLSSESRNSFAIISSGDEGCRPVEWREGGLFASNFTSGSVSLRSEISSSSTVSFGDNVTDPVVSTVASDDNYLSASGCTLSAGRNFTRFEVSSAAAVCLVGDAVRKKLFDGCSATGNVIRVDGRMLTVVGCIARKGGMAGGGVDLSVIFPGSDASAGCVISVTPHSGQEAEQAVGQARLLMRSIRRLGVSAGDDFIISTADASASRIGNIQSKLSIAALAIGLVTLAGAAISLMNVMLVGVKERYREIGLRKALGESRGSLRRQFLVEALIIGQAGAVAGSILGLLAGNAVAISLESDPVIPWVWLARASLICLVVSLAAGTMPAMKAASLAPVEALRDL